MQKIVLVFLIAIVVLATVLGLYFLLASPASNTNAPVTDSPGANSSTNPMAKGLKVEIMQEGTGEGAKAGDLVSVHYVGMLANGTKFDSSIDRNVPFTFTVGRDRAIKGFDNGVLGMKVGEKRRLTIPPELAYGSAKMALIPPNSTLIYDISMIKITK